MNQAFLQQDYQLIISTCSPYDGIKAFEAIDAAMGASNLGHNVIFLLFGEGLSQLLPNQQPCLISQKSILKKLAVLPLYDIEHVCIQESKIKQFGITIKDTEAAIDYTVHALDNDDIRLVCKQASHVLVF